LGEKTVRCYAKRVAVATVSSDHPKVGSRCFYEFAEDVISCVTTGDVGELFRREIARHGFTSSACRVVVRKSSVAESRVLFRNWPKRWAELSDQKSFGAASFVTTEARRRTAPFTWLDVRAERTFTSGEQAVWNHAQDWGWRDGFVIPVHGPHGYAASVSMASVERDLDLCPVQRAGLQMIALLAHERCRALMDIASIEIPLNALSERELECLRWVAAGKTDWEIGMILSISAATAKFHIDRARAKLGARNRAEATARLALSGLL
jgi:LuxR family quorum sensing-dependent transcriptional regulator